MKDYQSRKNTKLFTISLAVFLALFMILLVFIGPALATTDPVTRLSGNNRWETSANVALYAYPDGVENVIIARGDDAGGWADGLAGGYLAGVLDAPILLTAPDALHATIVAAIETLNPDKAYILGGAAAVSPGVKEELIGLGLTVERIEGRNRETTAAEVSKKGDIADNTAFIAQGRAPADSMVAGAAAFAKSYPILLVNRNSVPDVTADAIGNLGIENLVIVGGTAVVSAEVKAALGNIPGVKNVTRLSGDTREETSVEFAKGQFPGSVDFSIVNGRRGLADAVGASVFGNPILYVNSIPEAVQEYLQNRVNADTIFRIFGGETAVSSGVLATLQAQIPLPLHVPDDYTTIQEAIDASRDGDVIIVQPGTYKENIDFKGRNITLRSTDPEDPDTVAATVIDGDGSGTVVTINSGETAEAKLLGFTISGGDTGWADGGGIKIDDFSSPQIKRNVITENITSRYGAGAYVGNESEPYFEKNTFNANTTGEGGIRGSGIYITGESSVEILNNTFTGHEGGDGVIYLNYSSHANIINNTIDNNKADSRATGAGAIKVISQSTALIEKNVITDNLGYGDSNAGAITVMGTSYADIIDNTITGNRGSRVGAVEIYRYSEADITGNLIDNNQAGLQLNYGSGGGIRVHYYSDANIHNNIITNNKAWNQNVSGGGIAITSYGQETEVKITENEISNNQGYRWGGGIYVGGTKTVVTITGNSIVNNIAGDNDTASGGGIYMASGVDATIYDNTITDNWAQSLAGGIIIGRDSSVYGKNSIPWDRSNCPPASEENNTWGNNTHGHDRCACVNVLFIENHPCW